MIILKWPLIGCSAILSSIVFQLPDQEVGYKDEALLHASFAIAPPAPELIKLFSKKKKKQKKPSSKLKRHNRSMGKKFRRQNDDTLRR